MPSEEEQKGRHMCLTCDRPFGCKQDLVKHQYMHREKPQLVCSHCNKTFVTETNYRRHLNALQTNERKRYSCNNCGKPFRRLRDLESHHNSEHRDEKVFRCGVCQAEFSWRENLLKHEQVHEINPHVCATCGRKFIDLTSLLVHKRTHHFDSRAELPKRPIAAKEEFDNKHRVDDGKPFTCHICGRGFKFDFSYQAHLDGHVLPTAEGDGEQAVVSDMPSSGGKSKSLYVQLDSEGIIDLPALNSIDNEEVEIIVEVGNIAAPGATAGSSSLGQENLAGDAMKPKSETETGSVERAGESSTGGGSSQMKAEKEGELGRIITFYEPDKSETASHAATESRADVVDQSSSQAVHVPGRPYSSRPKKPPKRKRERAPFQFNCVMTDDKPFVCSTCGEAFRWEISLQVHAKIHTDGKVPGIRKMYMSGRLTAKKADGAKNGASQAAGIKRSRIVYQRHSSEEEEEEEEEDAEDAYAFRNELGEDRRPPSYRRAEKSAEKKFASENADDVLQEYLAGGEVTSDEECADVKSREGTKHQVTAKVKYQSDDRWKKGKAILRKKKTWKVVKLKSTDETEAAEADGEKPLCTEGNVMTSSSEIALIAGCSSDQSYAVASVENNAKEDPSTFQFGVVGSCVMTTFPFDLTAVTSDDRVAMAAAYSAVGGEPVSVPVVIENGFKQEEDVPGSEQLTVLQCIPFQTPSIELEDAVLSSCTHHNIPKEAVPETSATSSKFIPLVQNASSEVVGTSRPDELVHMVYEPAGLESTVSVSVSHVTPAYSIAETRVEGTTHSAGSELGGSRVIFFVDENPTPQIDNHEDNQILSSNMTPTNQSEDSRVASNFGELKLSSLNQKISAGLVALKAKVTGATRAVGLKTDENPPENSTSKSNSCEEEEVSTGNLNSGGDVIISEAESGNCIRDKKESEDAEQDAGSVIESNIPCQAQPDEDDVKSRSHVCAQCARPFTCRKSYIRHLKRHRHIQLNYTTCIRCPQRFLSKVSLERHLALHAP